jgi:PAS domain-containing protein
MGSRLGDLGWCIAAETPAAVVDDLLQGQRNQIYGLGILGSAGIVLLLALVLASLASRSHKATAQRFRELYEVIRRQKLILDGVNASLEAGLVLVDATGIVRVCNPAFGRILGKEEGALLDADLAETLPAGAAQTLLDGVKAVTAAGRSRSLEVTLDDGAEGKRLYRVTLFPYEAARDGESDPAQPSPGDCVGIFQDITEFRRKAEEAHTRQASLLAALVRAIESVDPNLVGLSQKIERVADLLAARMSLPEEDRETLRLGARLSQVGKIFVPRHLLTKQGELTPDEQRELMRAPEYAHDALRDMQLGLPVHEAVYQMGERLDGSGSPRRLKGNEIVRNARILAVANAFCAMVSPRSYRPGMSPAAAIAGLSADAGFDAAVVAQLASLSEAQLKEAIGTPHDAAKAATGGKPAAEPAPKADD